ncbi:hypothetical protein, partial [Alteripontixanthobacter muriae]|uniref:hypothetical protein n=1 Tax=Alteripontixanthobacter muriae TaxID=2705546 RepID=UPI0019D5CC72
PVADIHIWAASAHSRSKPRWHNEKVTGTKPLQVHFVESSFKGANLYNAPKAYLASRQGS